MDLTVRKAARVGRCSLGVTPRSAWRWTFLAVVPGSAFIAFFILRSGWRGGSFRFTLFDDAMVSMTYARTLAESGELVWYPGAPPVQGITNPLWTLFMATFHLLRIDPSSTSLLVMVVSAVSLIGCAVLVFRLVHASTPQVAATFAAASAAGTVLLIFPTVFWALRGMEVGALALVAAASTVLLFRQLVAWDSGASGARFLSAAVLVTGVGVAIRLDYVVVGAAVLGVGVCWTANRMQRRQVALGMAVVLSVVAVILLAQRGYYGAWLPNTFDLKLSGYSIPERVERGVISSARLAPIVVAVLSMVHPMLQTDGVTRRGRQAFCLAAAVFGATVLYAVWVGGDAWEWSELLTNRYVSVGLPLGLSAVVIGVTHLTRENPRALARSVVLTLLSLPLMGVLLIDGAAYSTRVLSVALLLVVAPTLAGGLLYAMLPDHLRGVATAAVSCLVVLSATSALPFTDWVRTGGLHTVDDQISVDNGLTLNRVTNEGAVVATVWAGAPAYYSGRSMVDLLGKSDPVVANVDPRGKLYPGHNKWDYAHSIGGLRPDVVYQFWQQPPSAEQMRTWGYVQVCEPLTMWALVDSDAVRWDLLTAC